MYDMCANISLVSPLCAPPIREQVVRYPVVLGSSGLFVLTSSDYPTCPYNNIYGRGDNFKRTYSGTFYQLFQSFRMQNLKNLFLAYTQ